MISNKNKKLLIVALAVVLLVITVTFLTLGLTIWKPKTEEEWLADFGASLALQKNQNDQKLEKTIVITESGIEVARYYQLVEIKKQSGKIVAHLVSEERFPSLETTEFDVYDEYYFYNNTMYMQRRSGLDVSEAQFGSTWEVFWEVANESIGNVKYNFDKKVFSKFDINHKDGIHNLIASVANDKNKEFLGNDTLAAVSNIEIAMKIDDNLMSINFSMNYINSNNQSVSIVIVESEPQDIEVKEFAKD